MSSPDSNYVYEQGTILVAPGGGGSLTPMLPGNNGEVLRLNPQAENGLGAEWQPALIVIKGTPISLKTTGNSILATLPESFIVTQILQYASNLAGTITAAVFNIGFTSSTYDDYVDDFTSVNAATGQYSFPFSDNEGISNPLSVLPANTSLVLHVTTADTTATTDLQRFDIIGYYL